MSDDDIVILVAGSMNVLVTGVVGIKEGLEVCVSKLSLSADDVDGLGLTESVMSGDEEPFSVELVYFSLDAIVKGLTVGDVATGFWKVDDGL